MLTLIVRNLGWGDGDVIVRDLLIIRNGSNRMAVTCGRQIRRDAPRIARLSLNLLRKARR